jgi:predicted enzyme related to lactoylglutathione lyase
MKIKSMSPQLVVSDLEGSIGFYTQQLGFGIEFRYEDFYASIIKDGFTIHLKSGEPSQDERRGKRRNEDLDLVFSVFDIEKIYREFTGKHIEIVQPLRQMPYGKEFYIADPDGYILAYVSAE